MATDDYTRMWEAWVGGFGTTAELDPGRESIDPERIVDFYGQVVGPAWGGEYAEGGTDFGETFRNYISGFDTGELERAEREFRMSIGDPYTYGQDPFAWERISRMEPDQAQIQLEAELFGQGKRLGGETGAEYGTGTAKELEAYTTGIAGTRESLTYEGLEGGQGLASGTSGAVLRSGQGITAAEDVLIEAYKKVKDVETGYEQGRTRIESDLETDLNTALGVYMDRIREEKEDWFETISADVTRATDRGMGYEFGQVSTEDWGEEYGAGLDYQVDDPSTPDVDEGEQWFMEDEACGIGKVRNAEGDCVVASELGLVEDQYGLLCPSGKVDCNNVCDGGAVEDCAGVCDGDAVVDACGECGGEGPSEGYNCEGHCTAGVDCNEVCGGTAVRDECGECEGPGPQYLCPQDGVLVCDESECDYQTPPNCPENTEWNGTYSNDLGNMCDPIGDVDCGTGYRFDNETRECEVDPDYDPCPGDDVELSPNGVDCIPVTGEEHGGKVECDDGTWAPEGPMTDLYKNCPTYEEDLCEDGTERPVTGVCPEDTEEESPDCHCEGVEEFNDKLCIPPGGEGSYESGVYANPNCYTTVFRWNCPDDPMKHGVPCSRGGIAGGGAEGPLAGG